MDQVEVNSGKPTFIDEIMQNSNKQEINGQSVCVTGCLTEHDCVKCMAKIRDHQSKQDLYVDTKLIEPFNARYGSLFQMIGELDVDGKDGDIVLKARVVRCVDGLDLTLYKKAVQCQRMYFEKRKN